MLYQQLDWNQDIDTQNDAIIQCINNPEMDLLKLMQPLGYKACWENCAKIISAQSDSKLQPFIPLLLKWLQDLTWPGAREIYARLTKMGISYLATPLEDAMKYASDNDPEWHEYLNWLAQDIGIARLPDQDRMDKRTL